MTQIWYIIKYTIWYVIKFFQIIYKSKQLQYHTTIILYYIVYTIPPKKSHSNRMKCAPMHYSPAPHQPHGWRTFMVRLFRYRVYFPSKLFTYIYYENDFFFFFFCILHINITLIMTNLGPSLHHFDKVPNCLSHSKHKQLWIKINF